MLPALPPGGARSGAKCRPGASLQQQISQVKVASQDRTVKQGPAVSECTRRHYDLVAQKPECATLRSEARILSASIQVEHAEDAACYGLVVVRFDAEMTSHLHHPR
jgi:hypothetical protein